MAKKINTRLENARHAVKCDRVLIPFNTGTRITGKTGYSRKKKHRKDLEDNPAGVFNF